MRHPLSRFDLTATIVTLAFSCACVLGDAPVANAAPTVGLTRLSGEVTGSLGVASGGVAVDVALERNHRGPDGALLEHLAVAKASTTTAADGSWSVRLLRPWGGDPRDEIAVHLTGAPAGIGDVDVAPLRADGASEPGLIASTVGWGADGTTMSVDCGDSDAGVSGVCSAVSAAVAGRPGIVAGSPDIPSTRLWELTFSPALSLDDHVLLTEERSIRDSAGAPVRVLLTRDAGMPRGGDPTVQRVAGIAPRCSAGVPALAVRCYELDARGSYTANGVPLVYQPATSTFDGLLVDLPGDNTVAIQRVGGSGALTVLHVSRGNPNGICSPGQWLGVAWIQSDLVRTQICPATGRMSGRDAAGTEVDEFSGGWSGTVASRSAGTKGQVLNISDGRLCGDACTITVRSRRVNAVLHQASSGNASRDGFTLAARLGTRTLRSLGRSMRIGDGFYGFAGGNVELLAGAHYVLGAFGRRYEGAATFALRRPAVADPGLVDAAKRLARSLRKSGRGTLRLVAPFSQSTTITLSRGSRTISSRRVRLAQALSRTVVVRRRGGATSLLVVTLDALGTKSRVTVRL